MERSSPLAAMQPQSLPFGSWGGFGLNQSTSNPQYGGVFGCRTESFDFKDLNFKELSMNRASNDYFALKPVLASSPTASLAADLSQNFHIDRSPQPPTPRRSLFSSNLFGNINGREYLTTPPLPACSPSPINELMEISPLPHKAPFVFPARIHVQSPTPEPIVEADYLFSPDICVPESPSEAIRGAGGIERRRPSLLRPSLSRTKGCPAVAVAIKSAPLDHQRQPFKFGGGPYLRTVPLMSTVPLVSLEEAFVESPTQGPFPGPLTPCIGPPRPKSAYNNSNPFSCNRGSPLAGHVRKPAFPTQRPRKQMRRSLSMFETPAEVMKQQKAEQHVECVLQSVMDVDESPQLHLPHFIPEEETIPRITKETMVQILEGQYGKHYDQKLVIDCRFEYEYQGGHIEGAINFNDKEELATKLFTEPSPERTLIIFHCEYSAHRAPIAARFIRNEDRVTNAHQYPKLTFPEIYILEGGYSAFYKDHKIRCFPQNYVEMNDKEHANACERGLGRIKQHRSKLSRAQTFAFGQHEETLDDSPTAGNKNFASNLMMSMDIDRPPGPERVFSRRMASY